jgi:hypothetical protein
MREAGVRYGKRGGSAHDLSTIDGYRVTGGNMTDEFGRI